MTSESVVDNPPIWKHGWNKNCFPPSAPGSEKSGNNCRKSGVHCRSAKHLQCTTALYRRAPWVDWRQTKNLAGNVNTRLQSGFTGISQCSPYQLKLHGNGTVGTDVCDHENHAGATKNTQLCKNKPSKVKKKVLLLELREQFHSRDKNLLGKESGTSRGSVLQEKDRCQWKGMQITVRGDS